MAAQGESRVTDTVLLYSNLTNVQLKACHDRYGLAYKEFRLGPRDQLIYAQALLRSSYGADWRQAVRILKELTRPSAAIDEDLLFECYVGLVIAHFKLKDRDNALFYLDECQRRVSMSAEQHERVEQLKRLVGDHFRFAGSWSTVLLAASAVAGAAAILFFKQK